VTRRHRGGGGDDGAARGRRGRRRRHPTHAGPPTPHHSVNVTVLRLRARLRILLAQVSAPAHGPHEQQADRRPTLEEIAQSLGQYAGSQLHRLRRLPARGAGGGRDARGGGPRGSWRAEAPPDSWHWASARGADRRIPGQRRDSKRTRGWSARITWTWRHCCTRAARTSSVKALHDAIGARTSTPSSARAGRSLAERWRRRADDLVAQLPALRNPVRAVRLKPAWETARLLVDLLKGPARGARQIEVAGRRATHVRIGSSMVWTWSPCPAGGCAALQDLLERYQASSRCFERTRGSPACGL